MATEQGYPHAQISLARAFEKGKGVKQDYTEAYFWYSLAAFSATHGDMSTMGRDGQIREYTEDADRAAKTLTVEQLEATKQRVEANETIKTINALHTPEFDHGTCYS